MSIKSQSYNTALQQSLVHLITSNRLGINWHLVIRSTIIQKLWAIFRFVLEGLIYAMKWAVGKTCQYVPFTDNMETHDRWKASADFAQMLGILIIIRNFWLLLRHWFVSNLRLICSPLNEICQSSYFQTSHSSSFTQLMNEVKQNGIPV